MKKIKLLMLAVILLGINLPGFSYDKQDYKQIVKTTKQIKKLSDKGEIEKLADYFSDDYKSFDGYNKQEMIKIYLAAHRLYPNSKTKEKITKIEDTNDGIKVHINETSKTKIKLNNKNALYNNKNKITGELKSKSSYAMVWTKQNDLWKILCDEIYSESTQIRYGEARKTDFEMQTPKAVAPGEEYTVKTVMSPPKNRFVVGSIGHDKIIFPPEKYFDPYRAIPDSGILERVMIANQDGINEYANSTFAFITTSNDKDVVEAIKNASISGMGIYVKRINVLKNQPL